MIQQDLFPDDRYEPPTIARASDPATSRAGAEHIAPQLGQKAACMMKVLRFASMTANEAARGCTVTYGGLAETYRSRYESAATADALTELQSSLPLEAIGRLAEDSAAAREYEERLAAALAASPSAAADEESAR